MGAGCESICEVKIAESTFHYNTYSAEQSHRGRGLIAKCRNPKKTITRETFSMNLNVTALPLRRSEAKAPPESTNHNFTYQAER